MHFSSQQMHTTSDPAYRAVLIAMLLGRHVHRPVILGIRFCRQSCSVGHPVLSASLSRLATLSYLPSCPCQPLGFGVLAALSCPTSYMPSGPSCRHVVHTSCSHCHLVLLAILLVVVLLTVLSLSPCPPCGPAHRPVHRRIDHSVLWSVLPAVLVLAAW